MRFTAPVPFQQAVWILSTHHHEVPVLADTIVELPETERRSSGDFVVKRRWKGSTIMKYTVVELRGSLTETPEGKTNVNARIQLGDMAYVSIVFVILFVIVGANSRDAEIALLGAGVIITLFVLDAFVLYRIIDSLKTGRLRS